MTELVLTPLFAVTSVTCLNLCYCYKPLLFSITFWCISD